MAARLAVDGAGGQVDAGLEGFVARGVWGAGEGGCVDWLVCVGVED